MLTERSGRVVAARKLTRRSRPGRRGRLPGRGPAGGREALAEADGPDAVREVFATEAAAAAHRDLLAGPGAGAAGHRAGRRRRCRRRSRRRGWSPSARCATSPAGTLAAPPRLAVALAELADPGNAGTVLRTADACGAGAVVFGAGSADPYNGKVVRSSAGSLFHVDVVRSAAAGPLVPVLRAAGVTVLAADGGGEVALDAAADEGLLAGPVLWLFGNEARGLAAELAALADARVRIPMRGRAESLNLVGRRGDLPLRHPARPGLKTESRRRDPRRGLSGRSSTQAGDAAGEPALVHAVGVEPEPGGEPGVPPPRPPGRRRPSAVEPPGRAGPRPPGSGRPRRRRGRPPHELAHRRGSKVRSSRVRALDTQSSVMEYPTLSAARQIRE